MQPTMHPKFIVNSQGQPIEVLLPWEEYLDLIERLGLDLDEDAQACLHEARRVRENGAFEAFVDLDAG